MSRRVGLTYRQLPAAQEVDAVDGAHDKAAMWSGRVAEEPISIVVARRLKQLEWSRTWRNQN